MIVFFIFLISSAPDMLLVVLASQSAHAPPTTAHRVDAISIRRRQQLVVMAAASEAVGWQGALSLLDEACMAASQEEASMQKKRWPHPRLFDEAILACARAEPSRWLEALDVLEKMRSYQLMPRSYAFGSAIAACAKAGQWRQSLKLLDQMKKVGQTPTNYHFNAALSATHVAGEWEASMQLLTRMRDRGLAPDVSSYGFTVGAHRRASETSKGKTAGLGTKAAALVDVVVADGLDPSERLLADALFTCAADGSHAEAQRLWQRLEAAEQPLDVVSLGSTLGCP
jgi:pentatricopeptide repeat protein